jgi:hypothetical protein
VKVKIQILKKNRLKEEGSRFTSLFFLSLLFLLAALQQVTRQPDICFADEIKLIEKIRMNE